VPRTTIYLLNIGGNYAPELVALTRPYLEFYANKIGAEICTITERRFPDWHVAYEKLQIHELAKERGDEWSIYFDSDALVHPELPDLTALIPRDTVAHNGADFAPFRWRQDEYFLRDGRHIGSCNWLAVASDWCRDLWRPRDDLTFDEVLARITPTVEERNPFMWETRIDETGQRVDVLDKDGKRIPRDGIEIRAEHLVDDYALSRNIARFGLKFTTLSDLWPKVGMEGANFFHHEYTLSVAAKIDRIARTIERWRI
jgi:hypothetical protein